MRCGECVYFEPSERIASRPAGHCLWEPAGGWPDLEIITHTYEHFGESCPQFVATESPK